jgi:hypothetical protein
LRLMVSREFSIKRRRWLGPGISKSEYLVTFISACTDVEKGLS